jgi:hypothetical protein
MPVRLHFFYHDSDSENARQNSKAVRFEEPDGIGGIRKYSIEGTNSVIVTQYLKDHLSKTGQSKI